MTWVSSVSLALMWQVMADICHPALTVAEEAVRLMLSLGGCGKKVSLMT